MATNTGRLSKVAIAKESTWGNYITPTQVLSVKTESLANKVDVVEDPRNVSQLFTTDFIKTGETPAGGLELSAHPLELGLMLYAALGKNDSPGTSSTCKMMFAYSGPDAYASITIANVGGSAAAITLKSGASQGTAANIAGSPFDCTQTANNTPAKLKALIEAVTGWHVYNFGDSSVDTKKIAVLSESVIYKSTNTPALSSIIINIDSISTTSKEHHIYPGGASDTWPSYTIMIDKTLGSAQAVAYTGCKADSVSIKLAAAAIADLSTTWSSKTELTAQTFPAITLPVDAPYVSGRAQVMINGIQCLDDKDITIAITPTMDKSHVVGSFYIEEQIPTSAVIKITGTANLNLTDYLLKYPDYTNVTAEEMVIYMENSGWADQTNDVKYYALFHFNSFKWNKYETVISGPNRLTVSFEATTVYKDSTTNHLDCYVVDTNTSQL